MGAQPTTKEAWRRLADAALEASAGDHTIVTLWDQQGGTARFANNQITQHVNTRRPEVWIKVSRGMRTGTGRTSDLTVEAIRRTATRAGELAEIAPEDPEYLPPLPPQSYPNLERWRTDTAEADPVRLVRDAAVAIDGCKKADLEAAGIVSAYATARGIAADTGLFGYERFTHADFSLTATGEDASGWVKNAHSSIDELGVKERVAVAVEKAKRAASPQEIPPGKVTVILEPAAVAGLIGPVFWMLGAKAYERGTSPFAGRLGERVFDERLTLRNDPLDPRLLGETFTWQGIPADARVWFRNGALEQLSYDRFTAKEKGVPPSGNLDAPRLEGVRDQAAAGVEDLIASTERGVLVTNFWYIRFVNRADLTLTGMTRDGTYLIEDGKLKHGLINFRWHDSPLRALNAVEAYTRPMDAITVERTKMLLPALKVRDFNFSSVTKF